MTDPKYYLQARTKGRHSLMPLDISKHVQLAKSLDELRTTIRHLHRELYPSLSTKSKTLRCLLSMDNDITKIKCELDNQLTKQFGQVIPLYYGEKHICQTPQAQLSSTQERERTRSLSPLIRLPSTKPPEEAGTQSTTTEQEPIPDSSPKPSCPKKQKLVLKPKAKDPKYWW